MQNMVRQSLREVKEYSYKVGFYSKTSTLAKHFSVIITWLLMPTKISPNQITLSWGVVNLITSIFLSTGQVKFLILVPLMIQLYIILDCVDGELARIRGQQSVGGKKLEQFVHETFNNLCIVGVTIGSYQQTGSSYSWWLGIALFFGINMKKKIEYIIRTSILLHPTNKEISSEEENSGNIKNNRPHKKSIIKVIFFFHNYILYKGLHILVILGIFNQMFIGLFIWALIANWGWIKKTIYWIRNIEQTNRATMLVLPSELYEKMQTMSRQSNESLNIFILKCLEKTLN